MSMKNKYLIILAIFTFAATLAYADETYTDRLVCNTVETMRGISTSCVAKATIEKDTAEKKLLDLQIKKVQKEVERMEREEELRLSKAKKK